MIALPLQHGALIPLFQFAGRTFYVLMLDFTQNMATVAIGPREGKGA
ncbi:MAG TPA: hypothetical protein VGL09_13600 [Methylomirabilota bacterium]|jgi:hypothetical protein